MKTRRRKNMKGCGKKQKRSKHNMKGGCDTCQSGGNIIYAPVSPVATTVLSAVMNVFRTFQGLIPII
jgi:hypothetical protein